VHDTNHVLNQSHLHYYERAIDKFREEYRGFYVEAAAMGEPVRDAAFRRRLKLQIIRDYDLAPLTPAALPAYPDGLLIPSPEAWRR
jgi:hypothetical protein